jgi:hypothetical protein
LPAIITPAWILLGATGVLNLAFTKLANLRHHAAAERMSEI